jgi:methyl-accepting chemotaxis protein
VVNEIKKLAGRVLSSSGQIHDIILNLQQEGRAGGKAIEVAPYGVQAGQKLSEFSGQAFIKIVVCVNRSWNRILREATGMEDIPPEWGL